MNKSSIINSPTDFIIHLQDRNWISFQFPSIKFSLFPVGTASSSMSCSLKKLSAFETFTEPSTLKLSQLLVFTYSKRFICYWSQTFIRITPINLFRRKQPPIGTCRSHPNVKASSSSSFFCVRTYLEHKNLVSPAYLSNEHKNFCIYYTNKKIHAFLPVSVRFLEKKKGKGTCTCFMYSTKHRMNG